MTKRESILLDILLKDFTKPEYKGMAGWVNISDVINGNESLKNISKTELKKLIYIIRKEQIKIGINLVSGESTFVTYDSHINDFLDGGGFKTIRKKYLNKLIFKWTLFVITVLTFILVVIQVYLQVTTIKTSQKEPSELKTKSIPQVELEKHLSTDSLNNRYHKSSLPPIQETESDSLK